MQSCLNNGVELRGKFVVKVRHAGKPLAGVRVEVTSYNAAADLRTQFSSTTAADETVLVTVSPGEYWLSTDFLGVSAGSECFHISDLASKKGKGKVNYDWGALAVSTQRIAGSLIDSEPGKGDNPLMNMVHRVETPMAASPLTLQNPLTGGVYHAATDLEGRFSFEAIPTGTYVLHVLDAHLLIALAPSSKRERLRLVNRPASGGSCGGVGIE